MRYLIAALMVLALVGYGVYRVGRWPALLASGAILVLAAVTSIWLYTKRAEPIEQPCEPPSSVGVLGAVCGFKNAEAVQYVASRDLLLITEEGLGGRVLALRPGETRPRVLWPTTVPPPAKGDPQCRPPSNRALVSTQGLSILDRANASVRVAIILHQLNHGVLNDSVQLFELVGAGDPELHWVGCIPYPREVIGNDLVLLSDGSIIATNYAPSGTPAELDRAILRGAGLQYR